MDDDKKLILVIVALWIVQTVLVFGPLRTAIEIQLIGFLFPYIDFFNSFDNLPQPEQVGLLVYIITVVVVWVKDALITHLLTKTFRKLISRARAFTT